MKTAQLKITIKYIKITNSDSNLTVSHRGSILILCPKRQFNGNF